MSTFAMVHGAWHDSWCWLRVTPLLQQAGHEVVAMDLPIDDDSADFDDYADVVCASLEGSGDDIVLVGHSLGGVVLPVVAARRPVRHLVYMCAYVPDIGRSLSDQLASDKEMLNPAVFRGVKRDASSRVYWADFGLARELMYADCDDATAEAAIERLRPQATAGYPVPFSLTEFPSPRCTYIVCSEDRCFGAEWSRRVARDRLRADLIEMPGSHSPFLSRPHSLVEVLLRFVQ